MVDANKFDLLEGRVRTVETEQTKLKTSWDIFFEKEWPEAKQQLKRMDRWAAVIAFIIAISSILGPIFGSEIRQIIFGPYKVSAQDKP